MATSVPNTDTFTLQDVVAVTGLTGATSLTAAFAASTDSYFDPTYKGSKDNLLNFRNYTVPAGSTMYIIGTTAATPSYSINNGANFYDLDVTGYSNPRSAVCQPALYKNAYTYNKTDICIPSYLGTTSRIWMSHNGGSSWTYVDKTGCILDYITVTPGNNYWYAGGWTYNNYFRSTDNGYNWVGAAMPSSMTALNFVGSNNGQYVYAGTANAGGSRVLMKSTDYGATFGLSGAIATGGNGHLVADCDDSGQYVFGYYASAGMGTAFSSDYGTSFTKLNTAAGQGVISKDATFMVYTDWTNGRLYMSSNQGGSWSYIAFPPGWTTGVNLAMSRVYKRVWIVRSNADNKIYKLNDAHTGWDLVYTFGTYVYGGISTSDFIDAAFVNIATSYQMYKVTPAGATTLIYTGNSGKYVANML